MRPEETSTLAAKRKEDSPLVGPDSRLMSRARLSRVEAPGAPKMYALADCGHEGKSRDKPFRTSRTSVGWTSRGRDLVSIGGGFPITKLVEAHYLGTVRRLAGDQLDLSIDLRERQTRARRELVASRFAERSPPSSKRTAGPDLGGRLLCELRLKWLSGPFADRDPGSECFGFRGERLAAVVRVRQKPFDDFGAEVAYVALPFCGVELCHCITHDVSFGCGWLVDR